MGPTQDQTLNRGDAPHRSPTDPHTPPPYPRGASSREIETDIERTRSEMDETLDALTARLDPRRLMHQAIDYFWSSSDGGGESAKQYSQQAGRSAQVVGRGVMRQMRRHPVPAMLMGAGLAWMLWEEQEEEEDPDLPERGSLVDARTGEPYDESYGAEYRHLAPGGDDKVKSKASGIAAGAKSAAARAGGAAQGAAGKAKGAASGAASSAKQAGGSARHAAESVSHGARSGASAMRRRARRGGSATSRQLRGAYDQSRESFDDAMDDYPLAVGAAFLALGIAAGVALPHTRREDEWMGETSDDLKHRAWETGERAYEDAREAAQATGQAAVEEAKRQGLTPGAVAEKAQHVAAAGASAATEEAQHTAEEEGLSPSSLKGKAQAVAERTQETAKEKSREVRDDIQGKAKDETEGAKQKAKSEANR